MDIKLFKSKLKSQRPKLIDIINHGYSKSVAKEMRTNFSLKRKKTKVVVNSNIKNFCYNYKLKHFQVRNISFSDILRYIDKYLIVANFDGGYICFEEVTGYFYCVWADDIENIHEVFCENETQFFNILLILTEYNSKIITGKVKYQDIGVKEKYIDKCETIYPLGNYEYFL